MNEERTIHLVDIPIGGEVGLTWNRLHQEREEICEVLNDQHLVTEERRAWLHARLRRLDDALDRLMAGSYGNCSRCGLAIDDIRLDIDPALALCFNCWSTTPHVAPANEMISNGDVVLERLNP